MNPTEVLRSQCTVLSELGDDERQRMVNGSSIREISALGFAFQAGEVAEDVLSYWRDISPRWSRGGWLDPRPRLSTKRSGAIGRYPRK